jgi:hypothetical protein
MKPKSAISTSAASQGAALNPHQPVTPASPSQTENFGWLKWAVGFWVLAIVVFHMVSAVIGHSTYRDIHLGAAIEYAKGSINLLKPIIVGFNLNGAPSPQELPLWQATAALAFKCLGLWFGWANLVSLLYLFSALYPLFRIARRFGGEKVAWWTLLLFVAEPLVFLYSGVASTDGQSEAAAIWFLFFALELREAPSLKWFGLTAGMGFLAAVSKMPFFMAVGLTCALMTVTSREHWKRSWLWLAGAAAIIGAGFLGWSRYCSQCYSQAELPFVVMDLRPSNPDAFFWFFGDLHYRLSPGVWIKGVYRILTSLWGGFGFASVLLLALCRPGSSRLGRWWLGGAILSTLVFFHIVLHHIHYYLMFAPAVAFLGAQVIANSRISWTGPEGTQAGLMGQRMGRVAALVALGLSTLQGMAGLHVVLSFDRYPQAMAEIIRQHTRPSDKLVIQGGGWGGELLILSERKGLSVWNTGLLEDSKTYERLKTAGFTKLVMVSESPLLGAIERSTVPRLVPVRDPYSAHTTPKVQSLPTVIQTEDILIKELP